MADTTTASATPAVDPAERRLLAATLLPGLLAQHPGTTDAHVAAKAELALTMADKIIAASQPKPEAK